MITLWIIFNTIYDKHFRRHIKEGLKGGWFAIKLLCWPYTIGFYIVKCMFYLFKNVMIKIKRSL